MEAQQVGLTVISTTEHKPIARDHVEESNTFLKIKISAVVFVEKSEQVRWHVIVALFPDEIHVLLEPHFPVSVPVH
ncbi:hypothetical protein RHMOL_Rhmol02G0049200 [Rhododendron molle]|uniref:Uncharacterized protein n=1 Tax=Rhododendron molle TaxID=49168 RepID=A0ACC0PN40_RHOML|nr:hypothetical protein RHMOL_Rhmol02G0049200 [Rhododendron molle]